MYTFLLQGYVIIQQRIIILNWKRTGFDLKIGRNSLLRGCPRYVVGPPSLKVFKARPEWGFEQPALGLDVVPAHGWHIGTRWSWRSFKPKPLYDSRSIIWTIRKEEIVPFIFSGAFPFLSRHFVSFSVYTAWRRAFPIRSSTARWCWSPWNSAV